LAIIGTKSIREYKEIIKGKVWVFPDNVDTDAISPGKYLDDLDATLEHTCETIIKKFPKEVEDGDIIVGGVNFGCGSSRETAPMVLQEKGIAAVVAEKFARIFYRSSIARALPVLEFENITEYFSTGDLIEIDIPNAIITNLSTEKQFQAEKIHPILLDIIKKGGLERKLLEELKNKD